MGMVAVSAIATSVLVAKSGARKLWHVRTSPNDKRLAIEKRGVVTHSWEHDDTDEARAKCAACTHGTLPKEQA